MSCGSRSQQRSAQLSVLVLTSNHVQPASIDLTLGNKFTSNESIGTIESVKTASDIIAPADGEIIFINQDVLNNPEIINEKPHEAWLCKISLDEEINKENYLTKEKYISLIKD